ncbi:MAG: CRISPR-associated protein Cas4 [Fervidicoccaceae archaeon]
MSADSSSSELFSFLLKKFYIERLKDYNERISDMKNPKIIYVTDLTYCPLKRDYRREYTELSFQFEPYMILGDMVHRGIQEQLSDMGYEIEKEFSLDVNVDGELYTIKGRIDAYSPESIVEIKTARSGIGLPHEHHMMQLKIYMKMTGVTKGTLIYVTPDRFAEYSVSSANIDLAELVRRHLSKEKVPLWNWECRSCIYSRFCPFSQA